MTTQRDLDGLSIETVLGDITRERVDAVVNAANSSLLGGGGVDGAIHRAGGQAILAECRRLRETVLPDGLPTGEAVATTAGNLPARFVIHTVGPVWTGTDERRPLLASCYLRSLQVASEVGAASVAFPAVSAGVYGWPMHDAARVAVSTVIDSAAEAEGVRLVRFVLFSPSALDAFDAALHEHPRAR